MRLITSIFLVLFCLITDISAKDSFSKKATKTPQLVQDGKEKMWCPVCGMSLKNFYKTSHTAKTKDGKPVQYCSIRCLVLDHHNGNSDIKDAKVVDVKSEKLISVYDAFYVVGSKVPGTMSKVSKLAFKSKDDAIEFSKKMGGKIVGFKEAYKMALESLQSDITMTNKKRAKKMYPMGKKLFNAKCDLKKLDIFAYKHINQLKPIINKKCKNLKEKQAQAVALYLWDIKRFEGKNANKRVIVQKGEKCPVCGMFVHKYPRWAAQIFYKDGHFSFDGVKDMIKYLHNPQKYGAKEDFKVKSILVTNYYTQYAVDGKKAFYVVGGDVLGPMGHELIPFKSKIDAKTFLKDHKGKEILTLDEITSSLICKLDGIECE